MYMKRRLYILLAVALTVFLAGLVVRPLPPVLHQSKANLTLVTRDPDQVTAGQLLEIAKVTSDRVLGAKSMEACCRQADILSDDDSEEKVETSVKQWQAYCFVDLELLVATGEIDVNVRVTCPDQFLGKRMLGVLATQLTNEVESRVVEHQERLWVSRTQKQLSSSLDEESVQWRQFDSLLEQHFEKIESAASGISTDASQSNSEDEFHPVSAQSTNPETQQAQIPTQDAVYRNEIRSLSETVTRLQRENHWTPAHPALQKINDEIELLKGFLSSPYVATRAGYYEEVAQLTQLPLNQSALNQSPQNQSPQGRAVSSGAAYRGGRLVQVDPRDRQLPSGTTGNLINNPFLKKNQFFVEQPEPSNDLVESTLPPAMELEEIQQHKRAMVEVQDSLRGQHDRQVEVAQQLLYEYRSGSNVEDVVDITIAQASSRSDIVIQKSSIWRVWFQMGLALVLGAVASWRAQSVPMSETVSSVDDVRAQLGLSVIGRIRSRQKPKTSATQFSGRVVETAVKICELTLVIVLVGMLLATIQSSELFEVTLKNPFVGLSQAARMLMG